MSWCRKRHHYKEVEPLVGHTSVVVATEVAMVTHGIMQR